MSSDRWRFERIGLGYRVTADTIKTEIRVTRLKRSSGELHGEIRVTTDMKGVKTNNGVLHVSRTNLSSSTTRERLAKLLEKRTVGFDMDWYDGIETLCQDVMVEESTGQPYVEVGQEAHKAEGETYLVEPLIPANVPSIIYAEGGSGKSVIALANALSIKTGWQYIPGFRPVTTGQVLYLDWETDANVINRRIQRISAGAGQPSPKILYRRCIRPLYEEAEEIANHAAERGVIFMVIDSAGMAMGGAGERGDANENTLRMFDAIRHINVTTQIIDHVSKQESRLKGKVRGRLPYGSIYKINLSRSAWEVRTTVSGDDEDRMTATFIHVKANDSRLHDDIHVAIDWEPNGGAIAFTEVEAATTTPQMDRDLMADAILGVMADGQFVSKSTVSDRLEPYGYKSPKSVWMTMDRMVKKGQLQNSGPSNTYRIPPDYVGQQVGQHAMFDEGS